MSIEIGLLSILILLAGWWAVRLHRHTEAKIKKALADNRAIMDEMNDLMAETSENLHAISERINQRLK